MTTIAEQAGSTGGDVTDRIDAAIAGHEHPDSPSDSPSDSPADGKGDTTDDSTAKFRLLSLCGHDHSDDDGDPTGLRAALILRAPGHAWWKRKTVELPQQIAALFGGNTSIASNVWTVHWSTPAGMYAIGFGPASTSEEDSDRFDLVVNSPGGGTWKLNNLDVDTAMAKLEALDFFVMPAAAQTIPGQLTGPRTGPRTVFAPHVPPTAFWQKIESDGNSLFEQMLKQTQSVPEVWGVRWTTPTGEYAIGIGPSVHDIDDVYNVMVIAPAGNWMFEEISVPAVIGNLTMMKMLPTPAADAPADAPADA